MHKTFAVALIILSMVQLLLGCADMSKVGIIREITKSHKETKVFDLSIDKVVPFVDSTLKDRLPSHRKVTEQANEVVYEGKTGTVSGESLGIIITKAGQNKTRVEIAAKPVNPMLGSDPYVVAKDLMETIRNRIEEEYEPVSTIQAKAPTLKKPLQISKSDVEDIPKFRVGVRENDIAVVIGIEDYQGIPKSDYSSNDAKIVADYLKALGYEERNIDLITDDKATKSGIEKSLEAWLVNNAKPDSTVFVYYSGHGAPDVASGDAYIVPYDGDPNYLSVTGYPLKRLYGNLGKLDVKKVIVILDSCFSGAGGRSVLAHGARPLVMLTESTNLSENMAVLTATQGSQISTSSQEKGHGVFTYFFLKAIKDGKYSLSEIYKYMKPRVENEAKSLNVQQSPSLKPGLEKIKGKFDLRY